MIFKHDSTSYLFKKFKIAKEASDKCREKTTTNKIFSVEADAEDVLKLTYPDEYSIKQDGVE